MAEDEAVYRYLSGEYTRDELREVVEGEAAGLPESNFPFGRFDFDAWLSDTLGNGMVVKVDSEAL